MGVSMSYSAQERNRRYYINHSIPRKNIKKNYKYNYNQIDGVFFIKEKPEKQHFRHLKYQQHAFEGWCPRDEYQLSLMNKDLKHDMPRLTEPSNIKIQQSLNYDKEVQGKSFGSLDMQKKGQQIEGVRRLSSRLQQNDHIKQDSLEVICNDIPHKHKFSFSNRLLQRNYQQKLDEVLERNRKKRSITLNRFSIISRDDQSNQRQSRFKPENTKQYPSNKNKENKPSGTIDKDLAKLTKIFQTKNDNVKSDIDYYFKKTGSTEPTKQQNSGTSYFHSNKNSYMSPRNLIYF